MMTWWAFIFHLEMEFVFPSLGTTEDLSSAMLYWPQDAIFLGLDSLIYTGKTTWDLITKV